MITLYDNLLLDVHQTRDITIIKHVTLYKLTIVLIIYILTHLLLYRHLS